MTTIAQGAEAIITKKNNVITKHRIEKTYRHPTLDQKIRKTRTRSEAKILQKLEVLDFSAPRLLSVNEKTGILELSFIPGPLVKHVLEKNEKIIPEIIEEIGKNIAFLHENNIIHGDLTTSNMIVDGKRVVFIDFGLGFISTKIEDKAVDLHLLGKALESTHHTLYPGVFKRICAIYKNTYNTAEEVITRLKQVEKRGRYKGKS